LAKSLHLRSPVADLFIAVNSALSNLFLPPALWSLQASWFSRAAENIVVPVDQRRPIGSGRGRESE
jgi:hypothetical protein